MLSHYTEIQVRNLTYASRSLFHRPMSDAGGKIHLPKLMLEAEAAALLRRSSGHVKRLRLERKLGYIPGKPVTIDKKDLEIYVAWAKRRRVLRDKRLMTGGKKRAESESATFEYVSAGASPRPFALITIAEGAIRFERTVRQIRYLCLHGHIPYILGRPSLIDVTDLVEHFEKKRLAVLAKIPPMPGTPEFEAAEKQKAEKRVLHKLRVKRLRREVASILAERGTR